MDDDFQIFEATSASLLATALIISKWLPQDRNWRGSVSKLATQIIDKFSVIVRASEIELR